MKLFDQMIKPILCYASEICSTCDLAKIQFRTGKTFAKYLDNIAIQTVHVNCLRIRTGRKQKGGYSHT